MLGWAATAWVGFGLAVILMAGQSICMGQEAGIAYWGSFGERAE